MSDLCDWTSPPQLDAPRRRMVRALIRARQKQLVRVCKGPKNHSTNKERSHCDRKRAKDAALKVAGRDKAHHEYKLAVRAWWLGERADYPVKPAAL